MSPRVTALVFAFNSAPVILRCLESIAAQTRSDEIHVVVHDDSSTDETVELARGFLTESKLSWEIISNSENQFSSGVDFFRRVMLGLQTPYVALCDADDVWISRDKIEMQLKAMEADDGLVLTHHSFILVNSETGVPLGTANERDPIKSSSSTDFLRYNFVGACTAMYRLSAAKSVALWDGFEKLRVPDYPFWGMLSLEGRVGWLSGLTSGYYVSSSGMSAKFAPSTLVTAEYEVRRWLWYKYKSTGRIDPRELHEAWRLLILDWQVFPGHRLPSIRYLIKRLIRGTFGRLAFKRRWTLQIQLDKIRTYWLPRRRD